MLKPSEQQSVKDFLSSLSTLSNNIETATSKAFTEALSATYTCVMARTPVKTGRLADSWCLFINAKLYHGPGLHPATRLSKPSKKMSASLVASTPNNVSKNANVYYVRGGKKWFDYAEYVLDVEPSQQTRFGGVSVEKFIDMIFNTFFHTAMQKHLKEIR